MKLKFIFSIFFLSLILSINNESSAQVPGCLWAKSFGSTGDDWITYMTADASGNLYATGQFTGTVDFDADSSGVFNLTSAGGKDVFIVKYDPSGSFIWAKSFGGAGDDNCVSIAIDAAGNIFTTGPLVGTADFDPDSSATFNLTSNGATDVFISKLNSTGNFVWAKVIGGTSYDQGVAISVDASSSVYITGTFWGTVDFDPNAGNYNITSAGYADVFVFKLDSSGNFIWAKAFAGATDAVADHICLDASANVYTTGYLQTTVDFNPDSLLSFNLTSAGQSDVFISKLDSAGNFVWAKRIGGIYNDQGVHLTTDASGNVYTVGDFIETADFDPDSAGTFNLTGPGGYDSFLSKLDSAGNFVFAKVIGGSNIDNIRSVTVDGSSNIYIAGSFRDTSDFDPDSVTSYNLISLGIYDMYVLKLNNSGNFVWAKQFGETGNDVSNSVVLDPSGQVYFAGYYSSANIPFESDTIINSDTIHYDAFIAKLGFCISSSATINQIACNNFTSPSGNYIWTISGTYMDTIPNAAGCDSVITFNLTINPLPISMYTLYPDTTTPHNWFALNQCTGTPPLSYVWNWGDSTATSTGATPSHVYADSGYYNICVTVTDGNGCINTYCDSSTYIYKGNSNSPVTINVVMQLPNGIEDIDGNSSINISPNPVSDVLTVSLNKPLPANSMITISDMQGRVVGEKNTNHTLDTYGSNSLVIPIDVNALSRGVYLLRADGVVRRFVKL